jgi:DnaJ family protein C protein 9
MCSDGFLLCLNYSQVTEADIEDFEAKYRGSDSEKKDLKNLYTKFKGKMNR